MSFVTRRALSTLIPPKVGDHESNCKVAGLDANRCAGRFSQGQSSLERSGDDSIRCVERDRTEGPDELHSILRSIGLLLVEGIHRVQQKSGKG